jgi:hypothetical protein
MICKKFFGRFLRCVAAGVLVFASGGAAFAANMWPIDISNYPSGGNLGAIINGISGLTNGDSITFSTGTFRATANSTAVTATGLTLYGQSPSQTILDGGGSYLIFLISSATTNLTGISNLTFQNGYIYDSATTGRTGAAVDVQGSLTGGITNSVFRNNSLSGNWPRGGAVFVRYNFSGSIINSGKKI